MKVLRSSAITWVITIVFAAGLVVRHSDAHTPSAKTAKDLIRDRIAIIFQETFKQGETHIELSDHSVVTARTFFPPTNQFVARCVRSRIRGFFLGNLWRLDS